MASKAKDRIGRLYPMGFRTTAEIRAKVEEAASKSGRSLTQEIEARLQASFAEDRMRVIAREEMQAAIAADREAQRAELMKRAVSDGRGGWAVSNRDLGRSDVCDCGACSVNAFHASDCAVHREPAYPNGPCDCGISNPSTASQMPRGYNY